jgi:hypothetical protein
MNRERHDGALDLRALYSLPHLADAARVSRFKLLRLLRANEVVLLRSGRLLLVPLSEIEKRLPALWESLMTLDRVKRAS